MLKWDKDTLQTIVITFFAFIFAAQKENRD